MYTVVRRQIRKHVLVAVQNIFLSSVRYFLTCLSFFRNRPPELWTIPTSFILRKVFSTFDAVLYSCKWFSTNIAHLIVPGCSLLCFPRPNSTSLLRIARMDVVFPPSAAAAAAIAGFEVPLPEISIVPPPSVRVFFNTGGGGDVCCCCCWWCSCFRWLLSIAYRIDNHSLCQSNPKWPLGRKILLSIGIPVYMI